MANVNLQDSRAEKRVDKEVFFMMLGLFSSSAVLGSDEARELSATWDISKQRRRRGTISGFTCAGL